MNITVDVFILQSSPKKLIYQKSDGDVVTGGVEGGGGEEEGIYPLEARPAMEHARTSAFEVYRKPHQGTVSRLFVHPQSSMQEIMP